MHIPDALLDVKTVTTAGALSVASLGFAIAKSRRELSDRSIPMMGVATAFVFAAQMVNFAIVGGTSGHLLGAVLLAVLLGPWAAMVSMTAVLLIQCLVFLDGGITALGANVLNMAVIGTLGGYAVFRVLTGALPEGRARSFAVFLASWVSVMLSAGAASLEIAWSGLIPLGVVLPAMWFWHAFIGVGEGLITAGVVSFVSRVRPDLAPGLARRVGTV